MDYDLMNDAGNYWICETLRRAQRRTRGERWLDRFNAFFWKILGV